MKPGLRCLRLLLWIGIILFFLWFLLFCFGTEKILTALTLNKANGYFMRLYGIFPLGWIVLFLFALKDIEKNIAIINAGIITGIFTVISLVGYHFVIGEEGWFHWVSAAIMLVYSFLLYICKPGSAKPTGPTT